MLKKKSYYLNYENPIFDVHLSEPLLQDFLLNKNIKDNGYIMFIRPRLEYKTRYEVFITTDVEVSKQELIYVSGNVKAETVLKIAKKHNITLG